MFSFRGDRALFRCAQRSRSASSPLRVTIPCRKKPTDVLSLDRARRRAVSETCWLQENVQSCFTKKTMGILRRDHVSQA
jgi:hypothetical protein